MKKIKIILVLACLLFIGSGNVALAASKSCGGVDTSVLSCDSGGNPVNNLLVALVNFLAIGVGLAVVTGIVVGAIMYTTAGSSADQAKKGIGYIRNAIIALVLYIFLFAGVNYLVPGGLF